MAAGSINAAGDENCVRHRDTRALEQDMVWATVDNIMTVIEGIQKCPLYAPQVDCISDLAVLECSC